MVFTSGLLKAASVLAVANSLVAAADVAFGEPISKCTVPGTFALTFDDGPSQYTPALLDLLRANNFKATFFVNGHNYKYLANEGPLLKQMLADGHQIASHTWSHTELTTVSEDKIRSEMTKVDDALIKTIGKAPTFMRPPKLSTNSTVLRILKDMQYHVTRLDLDTNDWRIRPSESYQPALKALQDGVKSKSMALMHDTHNWTVNGIMPDAVEALKTSGKRFVTVGECLGLPEEQWYREKSVTDKKTTTDGGSKSGKTCTHTVVAGDTCYDIGVKESITCDELVKLNPVIEERGNFIVILGEELNIPCKDKAPDTPTTSKQSEPAPASTKQSETTSASTKQSEAASESLSSSLQASSASPAVQSGMPPVPSARPESSPARPSQGIVTGNGLTSGGAIWTNASRTTTNLASQTVYSTTLVTLPGCPPEVADCGSKTYVATVSKPVTTITYPVAAVPTPARVRETLTAKVTLTHTIAGCPPAVLDCPFQSTTTAVSSTTYYCPGVECNLPTAVPCAGSECASLTRQSSSNRQGSSEKSDNDKSDGANDKSGSTKDKSGEDKDNSGSIKDNSSKDKDNSGSTKDHSGNESGKGLGNEGSSVSKTPGAAPKCVAKPKAPESESGNRQQGLTQGPSPAAGGKAQSSVAAKAEAEAEVEVYAEAKVDAKPKVDGEAKVDAGAKVDAKPKTEAELDAKLDADNEADAEDLVQPKALVQAEAGPAAKVQAAAEVQYKAKPEAEAVKVRNSTVDATKVRNNAAVGGSPTGVKSFISLAPSASAVNVAKAQLNTKCIGKDCEAVVSGAAATKGASAVVVLMAAVVAMV